MGIAKVISQAIQKGFTAGRSATRSGYAKLDAVNPSSPSYSSRRHSMVRILSEKQPEYTRVEFVQGLTYAHDLAENMASVYGIMRNLKAHTVGGGPWPAVVLSNEGDPSGKLSEVVSDALEDWFDDCDWHGRNGMTLSAICRRIVSALRDSGSILLVFDNYMKDNGRLIVVEASRFSCMSNEDFKTFWTKRGPGLGDQSIEGVTLVNGCVTDADGVVLGYIWDASAKYGYSSRPENCRWASKNNCWMFINPRSADDFIPMPELLTPYNISQDAESLRNSEVLGAAKAAKVNYAVIGSGAVQTEIPAGRSSEITDSEAEQLAKELAAGETLPNDYAQAIEDETGSGCVAVPNGSDIKTLESNKPKPSTQDHFQNIREEQGACIGAAASFAQMKTGGSYTAAMNDRNMTAANMDMDRYDIETGLRHLCVLRLLWESEQKQIDINAIQKADRRWKKKIAFQWPKFRAINPLQEASAQEKRLQTGEENFIDVHGPEWKEKADQREREYSRYSDGAGIPTTAFESTPGAIGPTTPDTTANTDQGLPQ